MLSFRAVRSVRKVSLAPLRKLISVTPVHQKCLFHVSNMARFPTPSSDPPKKEMQYFPDMTTALPSESGEFRRVLWTGLYSQLVLMTIPVDGDIGEEVRSATRKYIFCRSS